MNDCVSDVILVNGEICNRACLFSNDDGCVDVIYEVFRVYNGVPAFLDDHLHRMFRSAFLLSVEFPFDIAMLRAWVHNYLTTLNLNEGNVKLVFSRSDNSTWLVGYQQAHSYPSEVMYRLGVNCGLLYNERENPNAKHFLPVRQVANDMIKQESLYEVLLVNSLHQITEGSRTNVFFIMGDVVYTSPSKNILEGVTRKNVIKVLNDMKIVVKETDVAVDFAMTACSVFLTGTSPKVLPVNAIRENKFDVNNRIMRSLMGQFQHYIDAKVREFRFIL